MKKLVLMLAVAFSVSLFSCGNGEANQAADSVDSAATTEVVEAAVVEETVDSAADSATVVAEVVEAPVEAAE
ncbi:MAG: hypothetical protein K2I19_03470 [Muribaculaceae bacterium]|nr:hypothetical protein [Muribaculaceae bacterium]